MRSRDWYAAELKRIEDQRAALRASDRRLNIGRGVLFFAGALLLGLGWSAGEDAPVPGRLLWWAGWATLVGFLVVVGLHEAVRERFQTLRNRRNVLRRLVARLERRWDRLPVWKPSRELLASGGVEAGGVADDLDLFGNGSLMQLVSMAYTSPGLRTLAGWLTGPAMAESGAARAAAAQALVPDREARVRFYELASRSSRSAAEPDAFAEWATGPRWLEGRQWLRVWGWASPVVAVLLFAVVGIVAARGEEGDAAATFDATSGLLAAAIPIVVNLLLTVWTSGPIHRIFAHAVNRRGDIEGYLEMFAASEALPTEPEMIASIRRLLGTDQGGARDGMRRLGDIARLVVMRRGGLGYLLFLVLQMVMLWDVHLLARLERWQVAYGRFAPDWFAALGELEALQSLAALYDDYPHWVAAEWVPVTEEAILSATGLAHPLLADDVRVSNDVEVGPSGTVLLVTGSNMSGKSTMLRSIGLNVVLAGAGAPTCATRFQLPSIELATSIRVRDNLREGVSFYMAELHRLREVVAHARRAESLSDRRVLYLLDEILQGTNSRERGIAVVRVLRHLIGSRAIGAISTHDLELAEDPDLAPLAQVVHFREWIDRDDQGRETMRFDYRMREGVTPTTNALRLLEMVGLGEKATTEGIG